MARITFESRQSCLLAIQKYNNKIADGSVLKLTEVTNGTGSLSGIVSTPIQSTTPR